MRLFSLLDPNPYKLGHPPDIRPAKDPLLIHAVQPTLPFPPGCGIVNILGSTSLRPPEPPFQHICESERDSAQLALLGQPDVESLITFVSV